MILLIRGQNKFLLSILTNVWGVLVRINLENDKAYDEWQLTPLTEPQHPHLFKENEVEIEYINLSMNKTVNDANDSLSKKPKDSLVYPIIHTDESNKELHILVASGARSSHIIRMW